MQTFLCFYFLCPSHRLSTILIFQSPLWAVYDLKLLKGPRFSVPSIAQLVARWTIHNTHHVLRSIVWVVSSSLGTDMSYHCLCARLHPLLTRVEDTVR